MTESTVTEESKKKFIPKRRAPYLLQEEVINKNLNNVETKKSENIAKTNKKAEKKSKGKEVNSESKSSQLVVGGVLDYHEEVSKLYGIQKRIAHYFVNCCVMRRDLITGPITSDTLCDVAKTTKKTLKKILQRMLEKQLISRVDGKRGKGGFSVFGLKKEFIDVVRLQLDLVNNNSQLFQQSQQQSYGSAGNQELPKEWQEIDFTSIKSIGFEEPHLRQLYSKNITSPETIQKSIDNFSFIIENKPEKLKKYNDKLAALMSVLSKGGVWIEKDYMTPKEIALQKLLTQKKQEKERKETMIKEIIDLEYSDWEQKLSEAEKNEIIPEQFRHMKLSGPKISALKKHFTDNIIMPRLKEQGLLDE